MGMTIEAYLDLTESLIAHGDEALRELLHPHEGETIYRLSWLQEGRPREGFASAASASAARRICLAHEHGFGRNPTAVHARRWGTKADLWAWARNRARG